jgi:hypothetical protein
VPKVPVVLVVLGVLVSRVLEVPMVLVVLEVLMPGVREVLMPVPFPRAGHRHAARHGPTTCRPSRRTDRTTSSC